MPSFRPGQVIRFTYRHFWPKDANSREDEKQILVLHTRWQNKVHGVDMKVLTPAQLQILQAVMDPRNNRNLDGEATNVDDQKKEREKIQFVSGITKLSNELKQLEARWNLMKSQTARSRMPITDVEVRRYSAEKKRIMTAIENWNDEKDKRDMEDAARVEAEKPEMDKKAIPPMAREILNRMKPARLVNNPRIFYNNFIKPFLAGTDAYRTFFQGRMIPGSVQVDPRWNWTSGGGDVGAMGAGIPKKEKQERGPEKWAGRPRASTEFERQQAQNLSMYANPTNPKAPMAPGAPTTPGMKGMSPGAAEGGVLSRPAGTKVNKRGITQPIAPKITKAPRNK